MTNIFISKASRNIGVANTIIGNYTANSTTSATIIGLTLANTSNNTTFCSIFHSDATGANTYIVKNAPIARGSALVPIGGEQKIVLSSSESMQAYSNTASSMDAIMSMLQIVTVV